jgi:hypothetical protein
MTLKTCACSIVSLLILSSVFIVFPRAALAAAADGDAARKGQSTSLMQQMDHQRPPRSRS